MNSSADVATPWERPKETEGSLAQLQDWLRIVTTESAGLREGLVRARQRHGDGFPVRVPQGVLVGDRLAIYARGYLSRLLSCLRADFPALRALLGEEMFEGFTTAYLHAHPPHHYSLFELGAGFADHLERTCPPVEAVPPEQRPLLRLPIDLARTERARLEVTRAKGTEDQAVHHDLAHLDPAHALGSLPYGLDLELMRSDRPSVSTTPCLRVLRLDHDVRPFLSAVDRGVEPTRPEPRSFMLAVSRVDYRVVFTELTAWQSKVLTSCDAPRSLLDLAQKAAEISGESRGAMLAELLVWLPSAAASGLISYAP